MRVVRIKPRVERSAEAQRGAERNPGYGCDQNGTRRAGDRRPVFGAPCRGSDQLSAASGAHFVGLGSFSLTQGFARKHRSLHRGLYSRHPRSRVGWLSRRAGFQRGPGPRSSDCINAPSVEAAQTLLPVPSAATGICVRPDCATTNASAGAAAQVTARQTCTCTDGASRTVNCTLDDPGVNSISGRTWSAKLVLRD